MTTESSKRQHLASFLSLHHDIPIERAMEFVEIPDVEDYTDYDFVSTGAFRFDLDELQGEFSPEFLAREQYLKDLCKAYCHNVKTPDSFDGYLEVIQLTDDKRQERKYKDADDPFRWYTEEQLPQIVQELTESVEWLQSNIYNEERVSKSYQHIYDLNLSLLLYGLDQSTEWISTDFQNGYYTLRSSPHSQGFITKDRDERFLRDIGMRLLSTFGDRDKIPEGDELDQVLDETVESLWSYYDGPSRKLTRLVEHSITTYIESESHGKTNKGGRP